MYKKDLKADKKLCAVRGAFEKFNLISGLHTFFGQKNNIYRNILPPLRILNNIEENKLIKELEMLNFKENNTLS